MVSLLLGKLEVNELTNKWSTSAGKYNTEEYFHLSNVLKFKNDNVQCQQQCGKMGHFELQGKIYIYMIFLKISLAV